MQFIVDKMDNTKVLDIGCGYRPRGDVNLDIEEREVENFILGNSMDLPFEDNSFATAYSSGLSLWQKTASKEHLLKSWQEAIRVARDQVIFEFNFKPNTKTWDLPHPMDALKWSRENVSSKITLQYSERGKFSPLIQLFEKLLGTRITIAFLNKVLRRSYNAKLKLYLSKKRGLPEVKL